MFWGAPLVARELESGTYRLAWTQSVTRRRWLSIKVALAGMTALAVAALASLLVSWWFAPFDAINKNRFDQSVFTERGIVAIGYTAFAFALGVVAGTLMRRTLPAMAATLLGFVAVRIAFTFWARPHLLASRHALFSLTQGQGVGFIGTPSSVSVVASPPTIPNAWPISATLVDHAHHALSTAQLHAELVRYCPTIASGLPKNPGAGATKGPAGSLMGGAFDTCLHTLSQHLQLLVAYQPSSHYWPLQALETAIFLAAALALIGATIWHIGRRAARKPAISKPRELTAYPLGLEPAPEMGTPPRQSERLARRGPRADAPSPQQAIFGPTPESGDPTKLTAGRPPNDSACARRGRSTGSPPSD
jgi:hypothetical protein